MRLAHPDNQLRHLLVLSCAILMTNGQEKQVQPEKGMVNSNGNSWVWRVGVTPLGKSPKPSEVLIDSEAAEDGYWVQPQDQLQQQGGL